MATVGFKGLSCFPVRSLLVTIMRPSQGVARVKRCTGPSVRLSVCPSVPCLRFSGSTKAVAILNFCANIALDKSN